MKKPAYFQSLLGPFIISFAPFVFKAIENLGPGSIAAWRFFLGAIFLAGILVWKREVIHRPNKWTLLATLGLTLDIYFWHKSILLVGAGLATILANSQVIYMSLISLWNREYRSGVLVLSAAFMGFLGIGLLFLEKIVASPKSQNVFENIEGLVYGVLAGILYTVFLLCFGRSEVGRKNEGSGSQRLFWVSLMGGVGLLIFEGSLALQKSHSITAALAEITPSTVPDIFWVLILAGLIHVWGWLEIGKALQLFKKASMGLLLLLQPLLVVIWGWLFFGEHLQGPQALGALMIFVALALIRWAERKSRIEKVIVTVQ